VWQQAQRDGNLVAAAASWYNNQAIRREEGVGWRARIAIWFGDIVTDFWTSKIQRCKGVDHNRRDNNSVPNVDLRKSGYVFSRRGDFCESQIPLRYFQRSLD
jgi:hypothetical protein